MPLKVHNVHFKNGALFTTVNKMRCFQGIIFVYFISMSKGGEYLFVFPWPMNFNSNLVNYFMRGNITTKVQKSLFSSYISSQSFSVPYRLVISTHFNTSGGHCFNLQTLEVVDFFLINNNKIGMPNLQLTLLLVFNDGKRF